MSTTVIIIFIFLTLFLLFQIWAFTKSKRSVGKNIPFNDLDPDLSNKLKGKKGLIYSFSTSCSNCTKQTHIIEKIKGEYENIISIDAPKFNSIARKFKVMATPSIIFFGGNKIQGYYVGVKNESFIVEKLDKLL